MFRFFSRQLSSSVKREKRRSKAALREWIADPPTSHGVSNEGALTQISLDAGLATSHSRLLMLNGSLNLFDSQRIEQLNLVLRKLNANTLVQCIVLKSSEPRLFSRGLEWTAFANDAEERDRVLLHAAELGLTMASMGTPLFALASGEASGFGASVLHSGAIRGVGERALLSHPEVALGLTPMGGASYWLAQADNRVGVYAALTGAPLAAADLLDSGMATSWMDRGAFDAFPHGLAGELGKLPTRDLQRMAAIHELLEMQVTPDSPLLTRHGAAIERCFGKSTVSEILAALESESEHVEWARKTAALIASHEPVALQATLQLLRSVRHARSVREAAALEYRVARRLAARAEVSDAINFRVSGKGTPRWSTTLDNADNLTQVSRLFADPNKDSKEFELERDSLNFKQADDLTKAQAVTSINPLVASESPRAAFADIMRRMRTQEQALIDGLEKYGEEMDEPDSKLIQLVNAQRDLDTDATKGRDDLHAGDRL